MVIRKRLITPLCKCGCGQRVTRLGNCFLRGHHSKIVLKGRKHSEEFRRHVSMGLKGRKVSKETRRQIGEALYKHGESNKTYYYRWWSNAKGRCYNIHDKGYVNYGGRGIELYEPWWNDFVAARDWILANLGPRPGPEYTIDRYPDNDGNYEPGNLRWATPFMQNNNRRKSWNCKKKRDRLKWMNYFDGNTADDPLKRGLAERSDVTR